ncbi:MAG: GntR family transcriptional regulator [bacterium]|nr:GntR family transcriptional regulator [bacterium]
MPGAEVLEQYLRSHPHDPTPDVRLSELAYRRLFDALRNSGLEPGTPLPETLLSTLLGISRTPIREALHQLASDGLIEFMNGRAVTLAQRSAEELFDALRVRELIEPEVVRLITKTLAKPKLQRLQHLTSEMEHAARQGDRQAWSRADREWHEIMCDNCPNQLLGQFVLQARNRMYHTGSDDGVVDQYLIDGTEEHRRIVEAIAEQDEVRAEGLMRDHLRQAREAMFKRLVRS